MALVRQTLSFRNSNLMTPFGRRNANCCTKGDSIPAALASEMEICFGFLVVSIPTYKPIYRKMMNGLARAQDSRTRKHYQLETGSYGSNKGFPHTSQDSARPTLSPEHMEVVVIHDIELASHFQHNGDWIRVAENGQDRSRF